MIKIDCPKLVKSSIILSIFFLVLFPSATQAFSGDTINFQGKIVRNDSGYEGLNVTAGSPVCVVAGDSNDTCDFEVKYYSASSGGTLLLTEHYLNSEIGQYNGAFTLSLGSDGSPTAGSYSTFDAMIKETIDLYVQLGFSPDGNSTYTETFSRMPIQASAYALKSKYASGANTAFQFDSAVDSSGYTTPVAGMVYYDTTDSELKVYNGSAWGSLGGTGTSSLFTDGGIFTYLTSLTDHFVLGSSTYTAIGSDSYTTYLSGLSTRASLSFDMTAERLTISGSQAQSGLTVYSSYSTTGGWPVATFKAEDSSFDNVVMQITQDGIGDILSLQKGSTDAFVFENPLTFYIHPRLDSPTVTADRLYNVNGNLYWNGSPVGGNSLWTDAGTFTYLTSTTDDVIIGGDTLGTAAFFFDVSTGNFGIGTSTPGSKLDIAGSNSAISNTTGDITISSDGAVVIKANDTAGDNLMEWQDSTSTVLGLINQNGYASFGTSANNVGAMLTLGASTSTVAQINLANGSDVVSPNTGDMWWNGTNLYFYDGSTSVDLLLGGNSGVIANEGMVSDGTYLGITHNTNSYDIIASGWVCIGGSYNPSCTGGEWKNIQETDFTITQSLSNQWDDANTAGIIRSTVEATDVKLNSSQSYGMYVSPVVSTTNAQSYDNLRWDSVLNTYGKISLQTRSGATNDPTDGTWETWKPSTITTNYVTLQSADTHTDWIGTNATIAEGDITRPSIYGFEDEVEPLGTNIMKVTSSTNGGFVAVGSGIPSTDLSGYDYVTLWVRASQAGNTLRIGMGESSSTEQYEDITIDTADTWQKVYWDISDISTTNRDAITKLRVTNFSTSSNVIYVDNIKAEKLTSVSTGSAISSTPNSYFQYRVIFTTTNTGYQPLIENISLTYSSGFKIQIMDANTVRLYNNSGKSQKLKLDVILGSAAIDLRASEYTLNLAPSTADIDGGDYTNSIWVNKLGTGGNLLKLQTNSVDMMVVSSDGNMTLAGDVAISGGTLSLGTDGAGVRYNTTDNTIEFSNDGTVWLPLGDSARKIVLSAEYAGAVLSGDGSDNVGSMTSDNTGSSSNSMNYYEWNSSALSFNDYDVRARFTLPSDFNGWGSTGGVKLNYVTESTSNTNNKVDMYIYKEGSATIDGTFAAGVSSSAGIWTSSTIAGTDLNECATAGDTCVFIMRMSSLSDNYIRIGDIDITYNRSL